MSTHQIIDALASPLSAAGASATSVVGVAAVATGQLPAPAGQADVIMWIMAVGPSAVWGLFFLWKMKRAYHARRALLALHRLKELKAAGVAVDSDDYEAAWALYEKHSSWEAVTSAKPDAPAPRLEARR